MTQYKPVLTKKDFVVRYEKSEFGNHSPTWHTLEEFLDYKYPPGMSLNVGLCHIRNRIVGSPTWYNVLGFEVEHRWKQLIVKGANPKNLYISLMAPTHLTLLQGEVMRQTGVMGPYGMEHSPGLYLHYSQVRKPMREALAESSNNAFGTVADAILTTYLCPNSREWLNVLLDRYEGHVVEFSTYEQNWGTLPNYNTVFWEIRNY